MKGMATEQVVLLVLAIIVLAVVGYLVYNQFVKGNKNIHEHVMWKCNTFSLC